MSKNSNTSSGGIGITGLLFVVFLTLKIVGIEPVASWSWWAVTSPLWIPLVVVLGIILIAAFIKTLF